MFRTFARHFLPNPFDRMLDKLARTGGSRILLCWNRGLGDIPLGLYAMVHRINEKIPHAKVTFLTRPNLLEGFSLFEGVECIVAPDWKRGEKISLQKTFASLHLDPEQFDLVIEHPSPTDWVHWQRGKLTPKLKWNAEWDPLWKAFPLEEDRIYIGIQPLAETQYGLWRNLPYEKWMEFIDLCKENDKIRILLFGFENRLAFPQDNIMDLRGKTTLFSLLSIIKHRCSALILPDSGILSMVYYLNASFPIHLLSLWADPNHGILKQAVASPNPLLRHTPLIGAHRDLSSLSAKTLFERTLDS